MGAIKPLYTRIAYLVAAIENCKKSGNVEWQDTHTDRLTRLVADKMPSGSGIDNGTKIDLYRSKPEKLVFCTSFHHTDPHGSYDGWTEHTIFVTASLLGGPHLRIVGSNRNEIKEYLHDVFYEVLCTEEESEAS